MLDWHVKRRRSFVLTWDLYNRRTHLQQLLFPHMSTSLPPQQMVQYDWYPSSSYWYAHSRKQFCRGTGHFLRQHQSAFRTDLTDSQCVFVYTLQLWHIAPIKSGCSINTFRLPQEIQTSAHTHYTTSDTIPFFGGGSKVTTKSKLTFDIATLLSDFINEPLWEKKTNILKTIACVCMRISVFARVWYLGFPRL